MHVSCSGGFREGWRKATQEPREGQSPEVVRRRRCAGKNNSVCFYRDVSSKTLDISYLTLLGSKAPVTVSPDFQGQGAKASKAGHGHRGPLPPALPTPGISAHTRDSRLCPSVHFQPWGACLFKYLSEDEISRSSASRPSWAFSPLSSSRDSSMRGSVWKTFVTIVTFVTIRCLYSCHVGEANGQGSGPVYKSRCFYFPAKSYFLV